jgi:hypothetical protein
VLLAVAGVAECPGIVSEMGEECMVVGGEATRFLMMRLTENLRLAEEEEAVEVTMEQDLSRS